MDGSLIWHVSHRDQAELCPVSVTDPFSPGEFGKTHEKMVHPWAIREVYPTDIAFGIVIKDMAKVIFAYINENILIDWTDKQNTCRAILVSGKPDKLALQSPIDPAAQELARCHFGVAYDGELMQSGIMIKQTVDGPFDRVNGHTH